MRLPSLPSAPIRLRRVDAAFFLAAAAAATAGAAYLHGRGRAGGAVACGAIALIMAAAALLLAGEASCPHCGGAMTGLPLIGSIKPYVRCAGCRRYLAHAGRRLERLEDGHLAARAEFAVPLEPGSALPKSCCVCMRPASRAEDLVYSFPARAGLARGEVREFKAPAPYCGEHYGEAALRFEDLSPFPGVSAKMLLETQPLDERFVLKVRSYAFYRAAARVS